METPPWSDFGMNYDRRFMAWLRAHDCVLAVSAYKPGGVIVLGPRTDEEDLFAYVHPMSRPMALASGKAPASLWTSDMARVIRWGAVVANGTRYFAERCSWATGDIDIHAFEWAEDNDNPCALSTLANAVVRYTDGTPQVVRRSPLVAEHVLEDRVHWNGVCGPWATVCGTEDVTEGWRKDRAAGGALLREDDVVVDGLSMPHSPVGDGEGGCYLIEAGRGRVLRYVPGSGIVELVSGLPGFGRGLTLVGDFLVLTVSKPRGDSTFEGLPLEVEDPMCGVRVFHRQTGALVTWCRFMGVEEVFDVVPVPGCVHTRMANAGDPSIAFALDVVDAA